MAARTNYHPTHFQLAEDEEFVLCPYEISHQVTNNRLLVHLTRCRRNYIARCKENGELVPMLACKYNWAHHLPQPEIVFHERTCIDKHAIISHVMEYLDSDPKKPGCYKRRVENYVTRGVARKLPPRIDYPPGADSILSAHLAKGPLEDVEVEEEEDDDTDDDMDTAISEVTTRTENSQNSGEIVKGFGKRREVFKLPKMKMCSAPAAKQVTRTTTYYSASDMSVSETGSVVYSTADDTDCFHYSSDTTDTESIRTQKVRYPALPQNKNNPLPPSMSGPEGSNTPKVNEEEDWEKGLQYSTYNPQRRFEMDTLLKYPQGLSKSERKKWKDENVAKVKRLFGGTLHSVVAAVKAPEETVHFFNRG